MNVAWYSSIPPVTRCEQYASFVGCAVKQQPFRKLVSIYSDSIQNNTGLPKTVSNNQIIKKNRIKSY